MESTGSPPFRMQYEEVSPGIDELRIEGKLDPQPTQIVWEELNQFFARDRVRIILNFSGLTYLVSRALAMLVDATDLARARGGDVVLVEVPDPIRKILQMMGIESILSIESTTREAVRRLGGG